MNIQIDFTRSEKIEFLESLGYVIENRTEQEWHQWGNHDSQGNWVDINVTYAVKHKLDKIESKLDDAFQNEMSEHLRNILLYAFKNKQ